MSKFANERAALIDEAGRMTGRGAHIVSRSMHAAENLLGLIEQQLIPSADALALKPFIDDQLRLSGIKQGVTF